MKRKPFWLNGPLDNLTPEVRGAYLLTLIIAGCTAVLTGLMLHHFFPGIEQPGHPSEATAEYIYIVLGIPLILSFVVGIPVYLILKKRFQIKRKMLEEEWKKLEKEKKK